MAWEALRCRGSAGRGGVRLYEGESALEAAEKAPRKLGVEAAVVMILPIPEDLKGPPPGRRRARGAVEARGALSGPSGGREVEGVEDEEAAKRLAMTKETSCPCRCSLLCICQLTATSSSSHHHYAVHSTVYQSPQRAVEWDSSDPQLLRALRLKGLPPAVT